MGIYILLVTDYNSALRLPSCGSLNVDSNQRYGSLKHFSSPGRFHRNTQHGNVHHTRKEEPQATPCLCRQSGRSPSIDGLHGYLFGLAIIPEPVMPSEWLSGIFGDEMVEVGGKDEDELLLGSLFSAYNRLIQQNEDGILSFPFDISTIKAKDIQRMREW